MIRTNVKCNLKPLPFIILILDGLQEINHYDNKLLEEENV